MNYCINSHLVYNEVTRIRNRDDKDTDFFYLSYHFPFKMCENGLMAGDLLLIIYEEEYTAEMFSVLLEVIYCVEELDYNISTIVCKLHQDQISTIKFTIINATT